MHNEHDINKIYEKIVKLSERDSQERSTVLKYIHSILSSHVLILEMMQKTSKEMISVYALITLNFIILLIHILF